MSRHSDGSTRCTILHIWSGVWKSHGTVLLINSEIDRCVNVVVVGFSSSEGKNHFQEAYGMPVVAADTNWQWEESGKRIIIGKAVQRYER